MKYKVGDNVIVDHIRDYSFYDGKSAIIEEIYPKFVTYDYSILVLNDDGTKQQIYVDEYELF